ncbi:GIY-YIG nuclease family protein [Streptomyces tubercidicus]|uniref:GIY-YIG nuclease family protein n=1 Tax=Streptomyces tubercidicus TaxID=47759 RepID=UPI0034654C04
MTKAPERHAGMQVYVIGAAGVPDVKIGRSAGPRTRLTNLQVSIPAQIHLICSFDGDHYLEKALHQHFEAYRTRGEWFDLTPLGDALTVVQAALPACRDAANKAQRKEKAAARKLAKRKQELEQDPLVLSFKFDRHGRETVVERERQVEREEDWAALPGTVYERIVERGWTRQGKPYARQVKDWAVIWRPGDEELGQS